MRTIDEKVAKALNAIYEFRKRDPNSHKSLDCAQHLYGMSKLAHNAQQKMQLEQSAILAVASVFSVSNEVADHLLQESERLGQNLAYTYFHKLFVN